MKRRLTSTDLMLLEAARGLIHQGLLPSITDYNQAIDAGKLCGRRIVPIGEIGIEA
jgi:hypothetical protein